MYYEKIFEKAIWSNFTSDFEIMNPEVKYPKGKGRDLR